MTSRSDPADRHSLDAVYFDYKRRNDANFRKALRRDKKKHQSAQKHQEAAANAAQRQQVAGALKQVAEEGFPTDAEEREGYFMNELAQGELLCQEGMCSIEFEWDEVDL